MKKKLHQIIFESDTWYGKLFDIVLMILIVISVLIVNLESVYVNNKDMKLYFTVLEWFFTIIFTIEYLVRIWVVNKPVRYIFSFFGIIDLLSILPTYISIFYFGSQYLMVIRILRLIRVFRILKLGVYIKHGNTIMKSMKASMPKITVFLYFVILMVIIFGSIMYFVEGSTNPKFDNIPRSIYWAVITLTTVGYGDITPVTPIGQFLASIVMILGYAVIAVPTGIISAEFVNMTTEKKRQLNSQHCIQCGYDKHDDDAKFCKNCGNNLH